MNAIRVENIHKTFVLHQQHGVRLPVLADASLTVNAGECVVLHGHSGSGKSTLLRSLYANYLPDSGHIHIRHGDEWVDLVTATPRKVLEVRKTTIGWVSQFLRVIPRISALEVVMQPLLDLGTPREASAASGRALSRVVVTAHHRRRPGLSQAVFMGCSPDGNGSKGGRPAPGRR